MTLGLLSQNNLVLVVSGPQNQEAEIIAQLKQQVARFLLQPNKALVTTSPVAARRTGRLIQKLMRHRPPFV